MSRADWHIVITAELRALRRHGYRDFDRAWHRAERLHPASVRDRVTPSDTGMGTLFDETGQPELSVRDFHREACRQAWHDENRVLRGFSLEMLRDEPGENVRDWRGDARAAA